MANLIIIRGSIDAGKTTTCGMVYQALLAIGEQTHFFNGKMVNSDSLQFNSDGSVKDFEALMTFRNRNIGIISAGDNASDLRIALNNMIRSLQNVERDIIICCTRSINRGGSTFRLIEQEYQSSHPIRHVQTIQRITGSGFQAIRQNDVTTILSVVQGLTA